MDDLTKQLIKILRRDGRVSYSKIARELMVNRDYVADRINRLIDSRQLRIVAGLHPRMLGLSVSAHLSIKVIVNLEQILAVLDRIEPLVFISVCAGAFQIIVEARVASMAELGKLVSSIRAIQGIMEVHVLLYEQVLSSFFLGEERDFFSHDLDATDINIITILQQDGRANFVDVGKAVGLSIGGCRTRVRRLLESGVMHIGAIKQRSDMTDDLLFGLGINTHNDLHEVVKLLGADPGMEFMARTVGRFDLVATMAFDSLRHFNDMMTKLRSLSSITYSEQWLHVQIVRERYERTLGI